MDGLEFLVEKLQSRKLRMTKLRLLLLKTLSETRDPLSVEELLGLLSKNRLKIHKTSVYRQLEILGRERIVKEIRLGERKRRFEIYPKDHHHHFLCLDCGYIEDVHSEKDLDLVERRLVKERKLKVVNHSLEFFGLCAKCNA